MPDDTSPDTSDWSSEGPLRDEGRVRGDPFNGGPARVRPSARRHYGTMSQQSSKGWDHVERSSTSSIRYDVKNRLSQTGEHSHLSQVQPRASAAPRKGVRRDVNVAVPGWPATIAGCPAKAAIACLPPFPDQEKDAVIRCLMLVWVGQSYPKYTFHNRVHAVLDLVTDVLHHGLGTSVHTLPVEQAKMSLITLVREFGEFLVLQALVECCCFMILLNHGSLGVDFGPLLGLVTSASAELDKWYDEFG